MPRAFSTKEESTTYAFSINATAQQIKEFYDRELQKIGWRIGIVGTFVDKSGYLLSYSKDGYNVLILTVEKDNLGVVVISADTLPTSTPIPTPVVRVRESNVFCPTANDQARQFYNNAVMLDGGGDLAQAKELYLKAIELDPGFCDAMDNLGRVLRRLGDIEGAITWYKKSIQILPDNAVAHQNLAMAYIFQNKLPDALAAYQRVIQINPGNPEGYYGAGMVLLKQNKPREALPHLKKAEEMYVASGSPNVTDARYYLGAAYVSLEQYVIARDYMEMIYAPMKDNASVNYFLGLCYLSDELFNLERAKQYLTRAQELGFQVPADVLKKIGK